VFLACTVAALGALAIPVIPSALGYRVMVVISGSMEPRFHVGDAVLVRPAAPTNIAVGDTITFQPFGTMELKTHRVIAIERRAGHLYFQTQGDANGKPDPDFADSDTVLGTVVLRLPGAGTAFLVLSSPRVRVILVGVPALLIAGQELVRLRAARRAWRRARSEAASFVGVRRWGVSSWAYRSPTR
jgi:signal peptidase